MEQTKKFTKEERLAFEDEAAVEREMLLLDYLEQIVGRMKAVNMRRTDVATRLGKTKSYVTQLLNGPNMTAGTMSELALAVGAVARVQLLDAEERWRPKVGYRTGFRFHDGSAAAEAASSGRVWQVADALPGEVISVCEE